MHPMLFWLGNKIGFFALFATTVRLQIVGVGSIDGWVVRRGEFGEECSWKDWSIVFDVCVSGRRCKRPWCNKSSTGPGCMWFEHEMLISALQMMKKFEERCKSKINKLIRVRYYYYVCLMWSSFGANASRETLEERCKLNIDKSIRVTKSNLSVVFAWPFLIVFKPLVLKGKCIIKHKKNRCTKSPNN